MTRTRSEFITAILDTVTEESRVEAELLIPAMYDELRKIAGCLFANQPDGHTLQPTILVHEAYLKLVNKGNSKSYDRNHFLALSAKIMRELLADYARRRTAKKRGGGAGKITLIDDVVASSSGIDAIAYHDVLEKLRSFNKRHAEIVEMRCFGGMSVMEMAERLNVSRRTIELDWRAARAWMRCEFGERSGE